jgi:hypothetical protein
MDFAEMFENLRDGEVVEWQPEMEDEHEVRVSIRPFVNRFICF